MKGVWASIIILLLSILVLSAFEIWIVPANSWVMPSGRYWWIWAFPVSSIILLFLGIIALYRSHREHSWSAFAIAFVAFWICAATISHYGVWYRVRQYHHYYQRKIATTMNNIRRLASAWESYYTEHNTYALPAKQPVSFEWGNIAADELYSVIFASSMDKQQAREYFVDGWGNPFQFGISGSQNCDSEKLPCFYGIRSAGRDGQWDASRYLCWVSDTYSYESDIVLAIGQFVRWPQGGSAGWGPAPVPYHPSRTEVFPPIK